MENVWQLTYQYKRRDSFIILYSYHPLRIIFSNDCLVSIMHTHIISSLLVVVVVFVVVFVVVVVVLDVLDIIIC